MKIAKWLGCIGTGLLVVLGAGSGRAETPPMKPMSPQIVRVSYVQGDVRLSRGPAGEKATGDEWEAAAVDVPLYSGFTLVTGANGRAEIELEDASHAYLGENSVLGFYDLSASADRTHTELSLVSGVMTLDVPTMPAGDIIMVRTPNNSFYLKSPAKGIVRVNSYVDALELTPIVDPVNLHSSGGSMLWQSGKTMVFENGNPRPQAAAPAATNAFADWDAWVLARSKEHSAAMSAAMKEAGLSAPVPGLTEIAAEGSFFDCAPYGKCWAPKDGWEGGGDGAGESAAQAAPAAAAKQVSAPAAARQTASAPNAALPCSPAARAQCEEDDDFFPCAPFAMRNFYDRDPVTHKLRLVFSESNIYGLGARHPYGYMWGVCHVGSWIHYHRRYVWVAGPHRHHHWGVRWVKAGSKTGFVPVHPHDVTGKPPLNLKHGVYVATGKNEHGSELLHVSEPVKLLDGTPKEYAKLTFEPLPRAEAPHMEARQLHEANTAHRGDAIAMSHMALTLDHKTGSFQIARTVNEGGHEHVVVEPVGGRGGMSMSRDSSNNYGASNSGTSNAYRGSAQQAGWNNGSSRSYSAPSEGAHYSAPVSSAPSAPSAPSMPSAPVSAPSGPSGGAHH